MSEQAGRELDARVAREVMGFKLGDEPVGDEIHEVYRAPNGRGYYHYQIPPYSTSIAAAWEVVEKLHQLGLVVEVSMDNGTGRYCEVWSIDTDRHRVETETTIPHVICLAALKAVQAP